MNQENVVKPREVITINSWLTIKFQKQMGYTDKFLSELYPPHQEMFRNEFKLGRSSSYTESFTISIPNFSFRTKLLVFGWGVGLGNTLWCHHHHHQQQQIIHKKNWMKRRWKKKKVVLSSSDNSCHKRQWISLSVNPGPACTWERSSSRHPFLIIGSS